MAVLEALPVLQAPEALARGGKKAGRVSPTPRREGAGPRGPDPSLWLTPQRSLPRPSHWDCRLSDGTAVIESRRGSRAQGGAQIPSRLVAPRPHTRERGSFRSCAPNAATNSGECKKGFRKSSLERALGWMFLNLGGHDLIREYPRQTLRRIISGLALVCCQLGRRNGSSTPKPGPSTPGVKAWIASL